ncbi:hypothetical protein Rhopal_007031-T1 [Rhodotorula paludigena]|uniref:Uncharacterized protein n=1 Tax=Rhodotorula paludigena TaxID=86838 RepID=A0AAV5GTW5_9BASI|nr:hypothetical protein Rhopal_007031-T1 [Rhodotorula paludigena]
MHPHGLQAPEQHLQSVVNRKPGPVKPDDLPDIFHVRTSWIARTLAQGHHIPRNLLLKLLAHRKVPPATLAVWVDVLARRDPVYALERLGLLESAASDAALGPNAAQEQVDCPDWLYLSLPGLVTQQSHVPYLASQLLSPRFAALTEARRGLFVARCVQHFLKVRHYVALRETVDWVCFTPADSPASLSSPASFEHIIAALASERSRANTLSATPLYILDPLVSLLRTTMASRGIQATLGAHLALLSPKLIPRDPDEAMRRVLDMAQDGWPPHRPVLHRIVALYAARGDVRSAVEVLEEIRALGPARRKRRRREVERVDQASTALEPEPAAEEGDGLEEAETFVGEDEEAAHHAELRRVRELRLAGGERDEAQAVVVRQSQSGLEHLDDVLDDAAVAAPRQATAEAVKRRASPANLPQNIYDSTRLLDPDFSLPYFRTLLDYARGKQRTVSFPPPAFRFDTVAWVQIFRMAAAQPDISTQDLVAVATCLEQAASSPSLADPADPNPSSRPYRPLAPSIRIYTLILRTMHRRGEHRAGLNLWRSLEAREFQPDGHLVDAVVRILCALGRDEAALRLLDYYGVVRGRDDVVVIPTMSPSVPPRQRTMRQGTVPLDIVPFNAILAHLNRAGRHQQVYSLFKSLEERYGVRPDAATLSILIDSARYAGLAAGKSAAWSFGQGSPLAGGEDGGHADLAQLSSLGASRQGGAADDRWDGRPASKVMERFLWREVLESNWQDVEVFNPLFRWRAREQGGLTGWLAQKLRTGLSSSPEPVSDETSAPHDVPEQPHLTPPRKWRPFATTLSPTPPRAPHLYPNDRVFRSLIQLVGSHGSVRDIPLVVAWMQHVHVRPSRWTLCLAMAYVDGDAAIGEDLVDNWRAALARWLGRDAVPTEREIAWMRRGGRKEGVPELRRS